MSMIKKNKIICDFILRLVSKRSMIDKEKLKSLTDEELAMEMAKSLDILFFEEIYNRYESVVFNKCLSFTKSKTVAQDIAHDIFLKLFVSIGKFEGKSKFSTWLYSLTYNWIFRSDHASHFGQTVPL